MRFFLFYVLPFAPAHAGKCFVKLLTRQNHGASKFRRVKKLTRQKKLSSQKIGTSENWHVKILARQKIDTSEKWHVKILARQKIDTSKFRRIWQRLTLHALHFTQ